MYLKSLEVQGFKSFPEKTLIRFGHDVTAIVGPNGSGKSNISDAILWVMGEQSSKTLRGAKMEDVIFGGTQSRRSVGFAEASLTLDNADRALAVDADEVTVTRRYYRSGDSEYYINRQSARLRDIHELFMDTGLGREGYSNIGQGRIDEILSLRSPDRREIFEEAAGISKYRHRKEETGRKLDQTQENLLRIGDKISELELQRQPLKGQAQQARAYLTLREELQELEISIWLDSLERLSAAAQKAQADHGDASAELERAKDELEGQYSTVRRLSEQLRRQDMELEAARSRSSQLDAAGQQTEGQLAVLRSRVEQNGGNLERFREELSDSDSRSTHLKTQMEESRRRIGEIEAALQEKTAGAEALNAELSKLTAHAQGTSRQFPELRKAQTALTAEIAGAEAAVSNLEAAMAQNELRLQKLQTASAQETERREAAEQELMQTTRMLDRAKAQVEQGQNVLSGHILRLEARSARQEELERQERSLHGMLDGLQARIKVFQAMERDYESYQKSVRLVMQQAQRGGLARIHGPVSRLIRTEERYATAVEIALGGAMQQIVVDSEADGKAAISYLKRVGGGRATFLPLSAIRGRRLEEAGLEQVRGFLGLASDLVETEPKYRAVVEQLLGRTVLAEDLDAAIAMAGRYRNRFKIVTLDGQVMNPGGSMTGGSVNREAGLLSRANELEKLIQQEQKLGGQQQALLQELDEAQRQRSEAEAQQTAAREALRDAENQVLRLQAQQEQGRLLVEALTEHGAAQTEERSSVETSLETDRQRLDQQRQRLKADRAELTRTESALQQAEGREQTLTRSISELTDRLHREKTACAALDAEKTTALSHLEQLRRFHGELDGDQAQKQAAMEAIRRENTRLEGQILKLEDKRQEGLRGLEQLRVQLDRILQTRAETEAQKTKAERMIQEKNKDILTRERACALLEQKKLSAELEEKQIIDRLWDSYQLTPAAAEPKRIPLPSVAEAGRRLAGLRQRLGALGTPNLGAIEEFDRVEQRYTYLTSQRDDVLGSKKELEGVISELEREMTQIFVVEFEKINQCFGETFREMFGGGQGRLLLEDPARPLDCGIEIRVQPPGKQVKTITLLSGGEKAFVAIALYFAILKVRPTPFCILDEIDAALDDRNVERFSAYLHSLSARTQFIVITHRRGTMEACDVLYGVTMQEQGISRLLRLDLNQMDELLELTK